MKRAWVLFRDGRPGTFAYDTKEAAERVASKGHEVVEMVDAASAASAIECLKATHAHMPLSLREAVRLGDVEACRQYAKRTADFIESQALEAERERAGRAKIEAALFRVQHGPENTKALRNIAKRYFKGRTPTIIATLDHRTKALEKARALLQAVAEGYMSLLRSDYPDPEIPESISSATEFLKESA